MPDERITSVQAYCVGCGRTAPYYVNGFCPQCWPQPQALTKREWFAAMAMQGMLANPSYAEKLARHEMQRGTEIVDRAIAAACYRISDAMIKEGEGHGSELP